MHYFVLYFTIYILGILICNYISFKVALVLSIIIFIIVFFLTKKLVACILIILFTILSYTSINYNSKSILVQHLNGNIDVTVKIIKMADNAQKTTSRSFNNNFSVIDEHIDNIKHGSNYIKYDVCVTNINGENINEKSILYANKRYAIKENAIYKINCDVSEIQSNKNFLLFNYKNYLKTKKIHTILFAKEAPYIAEENYSHANLLKIKFKSFIENLFYSNMSEENANIILSIILGDKNYLDKDLYSNIQKIGLAHVFAVSGLHIGILYSVFLKFLCICGLNKKTSWIITWIILWTYGYFIGFPISVLRSLLMFTFLFGAELLYRKYNTINSIVISALILLIYNPFYLFDAGFQLSFMAAFTLIIYNKYLKPNIKIKNKLLSSILLYLVIQVFTYPILSYYFNYLSIVGILYNLLMLPVFSFVTIFSFLCVFVGSISRYTIVVPLMIADKLLSIISFYITNGSDKLLSGITVSSLSVLNSGFYYTFVFIIIFFINNRNIVYKKSFAYIFMFFYITNFIFLPACFNGLELKVVDVGQGVFCVMKENNKVFVFDAGSISEDIGKYVCSPYMIKHGFSSIDSIFVSHWHSDHYSGINDILKDCYVENIYASHESQKRLLNKKCIILKSGQKISYNKLKLDVIWPDKGYESSNENNYSGVILINYNNKKILITGDIESEVENMIVDRLPKIDILIVPHHGSDTSSSNKFVDRVNPDIAIMCYGKNNYGIPSKQVINRYLQHNTDLLSTFNDGEINIMVIDDKIYYNTYEGQCSKNYDDIDNTILLYNTTVFLLSAFMNIKRAKLLLNRCDIDIINKCM